MQKNKKRDIDYASFSGVSVLLERRLAIYREMLGLARNREAALTSDQFSEIVSIAARKAELAAEAERIDGEVRSCLKHLDSEGAAAAGAAATRKKHEDDLRAVVDELIDLEGRFQDAGERRIERMKSSRDKMNAGSSMARACGKSARPGEARFFDQKQ